VFFVVTKLIAGKNMLSATNPATPDEHSNKPREIGNTPATKFLAGNNTAIKKWTGNKHTNPISDFKVATLSSA